MTDGPVPDSRRFNASQRQALEVQSNVALTAAAGSGKTSVLVERFLRILRQNGFRPEEIVAITFTDEAARQMREKIRLGLLERRNGAAKPARRQDWERALSHLPLAGISTIHGFCLDLLREYGFRVGLDPDFAIQDSGREQIRMEQAIRESLTRLSRSHDADLGTLLTYLSADTLSTILRELLKRGPNLILDHTVDDKGLGDTFRQEARVYLYNLPDWGELEEQLRSIPLDLLSREDPFSRRCRDQLQLLQEKKTTAPAAFVDRMLQNLTGAAAPGQEWRERPLQDDLLRRWQSLRRRLTSELSVGSCTAAQSKHFGAARESLGRLYRHIAAHLESSKRQDQVLDFEDLLLFAARLGRDDWVVERISRRRRFFLVDEFQDTNSLQWQLLQPFVRTANLLVVGDAKQSIYRFRNADVAVFDRVQEWIGRRGRVVEMPHNYRSAPVLVRFCNRVFSQLMVRHADYEAEHQEMEAARTESSRAAVESCFYKATDSWQDARDPALVSGNIRRLLTEGFRAGDIAILLRARTHLKAYESALRENRIPFQTIGGAGFLGRQEVLDVINLVRFLADPEDDVALVGLLRSPFFNLSDEDLYSLSIQEGRTWWDKLQGRASDIGAEHWDFASRCLAQWLRADAGLPMSRLVEEALTRSGYLSILESSRRSGQAQRNLLKLLGVIHDFESDHPVGPRKLARFLEEFSRAQPNEPEATAPESQRDAVRIYTIHGAKGLQFPVVVLPGLGTPLNLSHNDRLVVEKIGVPDRPEFHVGFKIRNPSEKYRDFRHPTYTMLRRLSHYRSIAEEKRLLYVAMTRAQERLLLVGAQTDRLSCYRWLRPALQSGLSREVSVAPGPPAETTPAQSVSAQPASQEPAPDSDVHRRQARPRRSAVLEEAPSQRRLWSPTEITRWHNCPRQFFLSNVAGFRQESSLQYLPTHPQAALLGEVVHSILERVRDLSDQESLELECSNWARPAEALLGEEAAPAFFSRVRSHVATVASSDCQDEMLRATTLYREKRLSLRVAGKRISGIVDRLYQRPDGRWVVVDFKTHAGGARPRQSRQEDRLQVELYLWAVSRILKTDGLSGILFFTATGETIPVDYDQGVGRRCRQHVERLPTGNDMESYPLTTRPRMCRSCAYPEQGLCGGIVTADGQQELFPGHPDLPAAGL